MNDTIGEKKQVESAAPPPDAVADARQAINAQLSECQTQYQQVCGREVALKNQIEALQRQLTVVITERTETAGQLKGLQSAIGIVTGGH